MKKFFKSYFDGYEYLEHKYQKRKEMIYNLIIFLIVGILLYIIVR